MEPQRTPPCDAGKVSDAFFSRFHLRRWEVSGLQLAPRTHQHFGFPCTSTTLFPCTSSWVVACGSKLVKSARREPQVTWSLRLLGRPTRMFLNEAADAASLSTFSRKSSLA
jgi:hypothetical protein